MKMNYGNKFPGEGEVVCHNFPPADPKQPFGRNGFRYWTQPASHLTKEFVRCDCHWPVEEHYSLVYRAEEVKR